MSRRTACSSSSAPSRAIGFDSPVRLAVLTRTPDDSIRRQSAGIVAASSTTSPGTSSATGTARPSRSAVVCCGSGVARRQRLLGTVFLPERTAVDQDHAEHRIAQCRHTLTGFFPFGKASPRGHRISAKWVNSLSSLPINDCWVISSIWLAPCLANRCVASARQPARCCADAHKVIQWHDGAGSRCAVSKYFFTNDSTQIFCVMAATASKTIQPGYPDLPWRNRRAERSAV
jgi:hypothetical protein